MSDEERERIMNFMIQRQEEFASQAAQQQAQAARQQEQLTRQEALAEQNQKAIAELIEAQKLTTANVNRNSSDIARLTAVVDRNSTDIANLTAVVKRLAEFVGRDAGNGAS